jgi:hypothetical protein
MSLDHMRQRGPGASILNPGGLTHPAKRNIIRSLRGSTRPMADIKSEPPAGFKSESVAGFLLDCPAGFIGIRIHGR